MTVELEGRVIRGVDMNGNVFRDHWRRLPSEVKVEARNVIRSLFWQELDKIPAKLHFHQLTSKEVLSRLDAKKYVKAWSLHIA